jgi:hypothetical protein
MSGENESGTAGALAGVRFKKPFSETAFFCLSPCYLAVSTMPPPGKNTRLLRRDSPKYVPTTASSAAFGLKRPI